MNINSLIGNQRKQRAKAKGFGDYKNNKKFTPGITEEYAKIVDKAVNAKGLEAEADAFLADLRMEAEEEQRQYALAERNYYEAYDGQVPIPFEVVVDPNSKSKLGSQVFNRELLINGNHLQTAPPDRIYGAEMSGERPLGIDGPVQDDSEWRTINHYVGDTSEGIGLMGYIQNSPISAEYLGPQGVQDTYARWKAKVRKENLDRFKKDVKLQRRLRNKGITNPTPQDVKNAYGRWDDDKYRDFNE